MECLNDSAESVRKASLDSLQAVTGKKMESISTDQDTLESLIEQWRNWWQAEG